LINKFIGVGLLQSPTGMTNAYSKIRVQDTQSSIGGRSRGGGGVCPMPSGSSNDILKKLLAIEKVKKNKRITVHRPNGTFPRGQRGGLSVGQTTNILDDFCLEDYLR